MSQVNVGVLLVDGPDQDQRSVLITRIAEYLQQRGVPVSLHLRPRDQTAMQRPGVSFLAAIGAALRTGDLVLVNGSWLRPGFLKTLGAARARMLQRAALGAGSVLMSMGGNWLGSWERPRWLPVIEDVDQDEAIEQLMRRLAQVCPLANRGPGAGAWCPGESVLLVGDRPNNMRHGDLKSRLPFVSMHDGGCSVWLADQLDTAGIPEERLYWINAYNHFDHPTPHDFLTELRPRAIIALGANAARWCQQADVQYCQVTHPQHHKRFHHAEPYGLGPLLQQAMQNKAAA